jgi:sugar lactone lactonase YvrE
VTVAARVRSDLALSHAMQGFGLSLSDFTLIGADLRRPECVLTTSCGDLYVSDERGGITRISPDGSMRLFSGRTADGSALSANGFALLADGSFLIAPVACGGVFRLRRNGQAEPFLQEADGRALSCPNFVLLDNEGRVWICCLTQQDRKAILSYPRHRRDGYIVLVDRDGARIVADGIGYPNEVRVDPSGRYLYTNETMAARLLRYRIGPRGTLGPPEVIAEFDESNMLDGFTLDSTGGAWITAIVSNRLWYVMPDGTAQLLIEDAHPGQLLRFTEMQKGAGVLKSVLYEEHGSTLRNISSVAFGGPDLMTAYMGSLMGSRLLAFRSPVAGQKPAHWHFGPFD